MFFRGCHMIRSNIKDEKCKKVKIYRKLNGGLPNTGGRKRKVFGLRIDESYHKLLVTKLSDEARNDIRFVVKAISIIDELSRQPYMRNIDREELTAELMYKYFKGEMGGNLSKKKVKKVRGKRKRHIEDYS